MIAAGCMRRFAALLVLLVLAGLLLGGWLFRDRLLTAWRDIRGLQDEALVATPELAAAAELKLEGLRDGTRSQVSLSSVELQSLLIYRYPAMLPPFLDSARVEIEGDRLRLRARVPVDKLPQVDGLGQAAAFLPDTAELTLAGRLIPLSPGRVGFAIDDVSAARFPLPRRVVPGALQRLGRRDEPGLPPDAMALPLPPGAQSAYIRRDSLVLLAQPRAPDP